MTLPETCFIFYTDIENLYTNIETDMGMGAIKRILEKYPDKSRPDQELLDLLHLNLTNNDFVFDGQIFLQMKGTAMGKRFAPAYASIYLAEWEDTVFEKCRKKPLIYLRYLDDIWGIWTYNQTEFETFVSILNNHHPSINIQPTLHKNTINFLDTTTFKGPTFHPTGKLDIKVFFKSTDTHAFLHKDSFHPPQTFKGIVRSQLLRFQRICTVEKDVAQATKIIFQVLQKRGYSRSLLRRIQTTKGEPPPNQKEETPLIPKSLRSTHPTWYRHTAD